MADELAEAAAARGSGGYWAGGRTRTLSLELRAALAARAYIRHHLTGYHDTLVDLATEDVWDDEYLYRQVKAEAQRVVDEFLAEHQRPTT